MPIAFVCIIFRAYFVLRKKYFVVGNVRSIWNGIEVSDEEAIHIIAILFYPLAAAYGIFLLIRVMFEKSIEKFLSLFNPNAKIIKGKVALFQVGEYVRWVYDDELTTENIRRTKILRIDSDKIVITSERFIRKDHFVLHGDDLLGIAEKSNILYVENS
jgi:hypothetical protein